MKIRIAIFLFLIVGFLAWKMSLSQGLQTITVGTTKLSVEVANTPQTIQKGLGQRDEIGSDGLLFVLPSRGIPTFWMKDMRFPLDFVWIDTDTIVDTTENVDPQIGQSIKQLRIYSPSSPVTHVLEMNAGDVSKYKFKVGDKVLF